MVGGDVFFCCWRVEVGEVVGEEGVVGCVGWEGGEVGGVWGEVVCDGGGSGERGVCEEGEDGDGVYCGGLWEKDLFGEMCEVIDIGWVVVVLME